MAYIRAISGLSWTQIQDLFGKTLPMCSVSFVQTNGPATHVRVVLKEDNTEQRLNQLVRVFGPELTPRWFGEFVVVSEDPETIRKERDESWRQRLLRDQEARQRLEQQ